MDLLASSLAIVAIVALFFYFILALLIHQSMTQSKSDLSIFQIQSSNQRFILVEARKFLVDFFRVIPIGFKKIIVRWEEEEN